MLWGGMGQDRAEQAISRIERALARIEVAAGRAPAGEAAGDRDDSGLREAHYALRGKVESAIAQIDRLLATAGEG
jgi:hypothetical protein